MTARWLAALTIIMSVPLFASYQIKHVLFSPGYLFVTLYTWGLIAVLLVPVLLVIEIIFVVVALRRNASSRVVGLHAVAIAVAVSAEALFLFVRSYA